MAKDGVLIVFPSPCYCLYLKKNEFRRASYIQNDRSMLKYEYDCAFFVAQKPARWPSSFWSAAQCFNQCLLCQRIGFVLRLYAHLFMSNYGTVTVMLYILPCVVWCVLPLNLYCVAFVAANMVLASLSKTTTYLGYLGIYQRICCEVFAISKKNF